MSDFLPIPPKYLGLRLPPEQSRSVINDVLLPLWHRARHATFRRWMGAGRTSDRACRRWSKVADSVTVASSLAEVMAESCHYSVDTTTVCGHVSAAGGQGDPSRALGHSRAGFTSQLYCLADARRRPIASYTTVDKTVGREIYDALVNLPDRPPDALSTDNGIEADPTCAGLVARDILGGKKTS